jgi:hypothetical protein
MDWEHDRKHITPGDSIQMAVWIGVAGCIITGVVTLVIGRAIDGVTASWPAPTNVVDVIFLWLFSRLHLVFAAIAFFVVGERVVSTILHDRDQLHQQENDRLEVQLDREREETRRMRLENDIADLKLKALLSKPPEAQREMLLSDRQTSNWSLTVVREGNRHELDGKLIEAYARGLRAGKTDMRDFIRKGEGVSFSNLDFAVLRALVEWAGVTNSRGLDERRLTDNLELWRTTRVVRMDEPQVIG